MTAPVCVSITGAAGQIGYSLLFRVASGSMLGPDQQVILQLLEITPALGALEGVCMELEDCAFPTLAGIVPTDDADVAFVTSTTRCSSARCLARRAWSGPTCSAPTAGSSSPGEALSRSPQRRPGARRRQPGQHELSHRATERKDLDPSQFTGDDPPRPQPRRCALAARRASTPRTSHMPSGATTDRRPSPDGDFPSQSIRQAALKADLPVDWRGTLRT